MPPFMKRMAGKLGSHLSSSLSRPQEVSLPSPASDHPSSPSVLSGSEYRGSFSTQATSVLSGDISAKPSMDIYDIPESSTPQNPTPSLKRNLPTRPQGKYCLNDFMVERTLGTGSFGRVHLVRSKHNFNYYAIKVLNKEKVVKSKQSEHTNNERATLLVVRHPFIINLWGSFQDTANLYLVMDYVPGGELFTLIRKSSRFPDPVAKFYAAEVAVAISYLHSLNIVYRDLKPENVLIGHDGHIKVADFGFAKECELYVWTLCGTPDYLAPEIVSSGRYGKSVDWYALGVLIYEMLIGQPPYFEARENHQLLYRRIIEGPHTLRWPAISENAIDIILKLMEGDPTRRLGNMWAGAGAVFAHPWFREVEWEKLAKREITAPYLPKIQSQGDASAFDQYPREDIEAKSYGKQTKDLYGSLFPDFEYTTPTLTIDTQPQKNVHF